MANLLKKKGTSPKQEEPRKEELKSSLKASLEKNKPSIEKVASQSKSTKQTLDAATAKAAATTILVKRDLKYKYPIGVNTSESRKKFRQKTRNMLRSFERDIAKLEGKVKAEKMKELKAFEAEVLR